MSFFRKLELEIVEFFDWNVRFLTFYDYLEHYLGLGIVTEVDQIESNTGNSKCKN